MILLDDILTSVTYIAASYVLFFIGKWAYQLLNIKINVSRELVKKDNLAFSFAHVGYFIAILLIVGSVLVGESEGLFVDLEFMFIYGLLGIGLLNLSMIINDHIIFHRFNLRKEIFQDQNIGTGIIEGANAIATGLIVFGSITGEGSGFGGPIFTVILYWMLGQVILLITSYIYNLITPYNIHEHIEKGNIAVGVGYAGAIIAIANLIRNALTHDFENWYITLEDVAYHTIVGLIFLPVARFLCDKILLPGQKLTHEIVKQEKPNVGAALVESFAYVGGSMLIVWAL